LPAASFGRLPLQRPLLLFHSFLCGSKCTPWVLLLGSGTFTINYQTRAAFAYHPLFVWLGKRSLQLLPLSNRSFLTTSIHSLSTLLPTLLV
jgi:hypothetical protein